MKVKGISERLCTTIADEQVSHAKKMNVTILRTIDLLFIMKTMEHDTKRGDLFISFCHRGGGRLAVENSEIKVIEEN